jgi:glucose/arabinose dehydrogenase
MRSLITALLVGWTHIAHAGSLADLMLPPGFTISLYTDEVPDARQLAIAPGVLFVGSREAGKVYAVVDADQDGSADAVHLIADGLFLPSGVSFHNGSLYVAEVNRVLRYDDILARLDRPPEAVVVNDQLPDASHHGWKFINFGPDGRLYVPVGAPCNVCDDAAPFATILRMQPDGSEVEVFARGVRNSVGFDWHPRNGEFWFTDNGRDWLGDDEPPCELNRAPVAGLHFGFPYVHGGTIVDPKFGKGRVASDYTPPALALGAHVAPLGIEFYRGDQFPAHYRNVLFVAEHGSWNRGEKAGYRVMAAHIDDAGKVIDYTPFVTGWLIGQSNWGRPVDFEQTADGSLFVSDDQAGAIYRIRFQEP